VTARAVGAAALLHVAVAVLLFAAGRSALAPRWIDRDGIVTASDSIAYRLEALELASAFGHGGLERFSRLSQPQAQGKSRGDYRGRQNRTRARARSA